MITVQFKIFPTAEQARLLHTSSLEYISLVNSLAQKLVDADSSIKLSSSNVQAELPSAVKNEAIRAAKSVVSRYKSKKSKTIPILKKPVITWNNQNFKIEDDHLSFPVLIDGKSKRITVESILTDYQRERLSAKHGTLRITQKNEKWMVQIAVEPPPVEQNPPGRRYGPACDS